MIGYILNPITKFIIKLPKSSWLHQKFLLFSTFQISFNGLTLNLIKVCVYKCLHVSQNLPLIEFYQKRLNRFRKSLEFAGVEIFCPRLHKKSWTNCKNLKSV